jgi:GNAT superfamily N-acetyltransferase
VADIRSLSDYSPEELVFIADEHDDLAFAALLENHPAMVREGSYCQLLTGLMNPFANMMFGMAVPDAEVRIKEATAWLAEKKSPAYWWVGPCTTPVDIDRLLVQNGWDEEKPAPAMAIDLEKLQGTFGPEGLELLEVKTKGDLDAWQEVFARGYGVPLEVGRLMAPSFGGAVQLFTAMLDGKAVGTTGLFIHKDVPGIYCVATLPEFRGRGIGAGITALPLIQARERGYKVGTLQASTMGYPVYKRIGFEDVCQLRVFTMNM